MKSIFLSACCLIITTFQVGSVFSQQPAITNQSTTAAVSPFASAGSAVSTSAKTDRELANINQRSLKYFANRYGNAKDVRWYASDKLNVASFSDGGKSNKVVFHNNGKWLHTLINYDETLLNDAIRNRVKKEFRNYSISWVTEVHEKDMVVHFVKIENERHIKELIVYDGEIMLHKSLYKIKE